MEVSELDKFLFDLRGYLVLRRVIDRDVAHAMGAKVDEWGLAQSSEEERGKIEAVFDWGQAFLDLIDHERTLPYLTEFVDPAPRLDNGYALFMIPGDRGLELHGGVADGKAPWIPTSTTWYAVDGARITSGLTKVLWVLNDSPAGSGGFCCIPGSHKGRFAPPSDDCEAEVAAGRAVEMEVSAGDAIIHTEALVHGAMPWRGPGNRRVLVYKYVPGYVRYLGQDWLPDDLAKLTDRQRQLVQPPYVRDRDHAKRRPIS